MGWYSWWVPLGWGMLFTAIGAGMLWGIYEVLDQWELDMLD